MDLAPYKANKAIPIPLLRFIRSCELKMMTINFQNKINHKVEDTSKQKVVYISNKYVKKQT